MRYAQSIMWGVQKLSKCHLLLLLVKSVLEQSSLSCCTPEVGDCPSTSNGVQALVYDGAEHACVLLSEREVLTEGRGKREAGPDSFPRLTGRVVHPLHHRGKECLGDDSS